MFGCGAEQVVDIKEVEDPAIEVVKRTEDEGHAVFLLASFLFPI